MATQLLRIILGLLIVLVVSLLMLSIALVISFGLTVGAVTVIPVFMTLDMIKYEKRRNSYPKKR